MAKISSQIVFSSHETSLNATLRLVLVDSEVCLPSKRFDQKLIMRIFGKELSYNCHAWFKIHEKFETYVVVFCNLDHCPVSIAILWSTQKGRVLQFSFIVENDPWDIKKVWG